MGQRLMKLYHDLRGFSGEICRSKFSLYKTDYWSRSRERVIRGLHYRVPPQQGLLTVIRGRIFDVMVELHTGKYTFAELSEGEQIQVPMGMAHGFCVTSDWADVIYKLSEYWDPQCEHGIAWDDLDLLIPWPTATPILSERDKAWPRLKDLR